MECLPNEQEALNSSPSTAKKEKKIEIHIPFKIEIHIPFDSAVPLLGRETCPRKEMSKEPKCLLVGKVSTVLYSFFEILCSG
jgi:hypothetical protein